MKTKFNIQVNKRFYRYPFNLIFDAVQARKLQKECLGHIYLEQPYYTIEVFKYKEYAYLNVSRLNSNVSAALKIC